ncbi:MAG: peptidoglycan-binding protein LysM [Legionella sp.]|nr:peptidoglycan-binding protein LysM [Legionella sp.]
MGLFNFIKNAGDKIFGSKDAHATSADSLKQHITNKLQGNDELKVSYNEGKVTVSGETKSQEEKEKILLALGNVEGVEVVEESITVTQPSGESRFYTVQKGDNLSKISKKFYNESNDYQKIFEANRPLLSHPDKIYPGQVLRIPE